MSIAAAQSFRDKVCSTPALQQQIQTALANGGDLSALVRLGSDNGCDFTVEEAAAAFQALASDELSEDELDLVAGGGINFAKLMKGFASVFKRGNFSGSLRLPGR